MHNLPWGESGGNALFIFHHSKAAPCYHIVSLLFEQEIHHPIPAVISCPRLGNVEIQAHEMRDAIDVSPQCRDYL